MSSIPSTQGTIMITRRSAQWVPVHHTLLIRQIADRRPPKMPRLFHLLLRPVFGVLERHLALVGYTMLPCRKYNALGLEVPEAISIRVFLISHKSARATLHPCIRLVAGPEALRYVGHDQGSGHPQSGHVKRDIVPLQDVDPGPKGAILRFDHRDDVLDIDNGFHNLGPQISRDGRCIHTRTGTGHDIPVLPFNLAILLGTVWRGHTGLRTMLGIQTQGDTSEFTATVALENLNRYLYEPPSVT